MSKANVDLYYNGGELDTGETKTDRGTAVRTDAANATDFMDSFAHAIGIRFSLHENVITKQLLPWLEEGFEIALKLKGYKSDQVQERRVMWTGDLTPYHAFHVQEYGPESTHEEPRGYE